LIAVFRQTSVFRQKQIILCNLITTLFWQAPKTMSAKKLAAALPKIRETPSRELVVGGADYDGLLPTECGFPAQSHGAVHICEQSPSGGIVRLLL
jgi:hypothetical protein